MSKLDEYLTAIVSAVDRLREISTTTNDAVMHLDGTWLEPEDAIDEKDAEERQEPVAELRLDARIWLGTERRTDDMVDLSIFISSRGWQISLDHDDSTVYNEEDEHFLTTASSHEIADRAAKIMRDHASYIAKT